MLNELTLRMVAYDGGDARRIQHFIKVHAFARLIGQQEGLDADMQLILEAAALVHDIGIRAAEKKYGQCDGKLQEQEGPPLARQMLTELGAAQPLIDRVCWLVAHHHTYTNVQGQDYRILLEADFLVNLYEDGSSRETAAEVCRKVFRTECGIRLCKTMFGLTAGADVS